VPLISRLDNAGQEIQICSSLEQSSSIRIRRHVSRRQPNSSPSALDHHAKGVRSLQPRTKAGECGGGDNIDLGVVFLENAYRCLKDEGRLGIVLSNSIASINRWQKVREWLMAHARIVALFDLPANVFAETGVNTTLIVAYKPKGPALARLNSQGYSVFVRDIDRVGYEKRTSKRNVFFNPTYRFNEATFDISTDSEGRPVLDEEFTDAVREFKHWALGQEATLQRLFLKES